MRRNPTPETGTGSHASVRTSSASASSCATCSPTGAATDVLGTCTTWGAGVAHHRPGRARAGRHRAGRRRHREAGATARVRAGTGPAARGSSSTRRRWAEVDARAARRVGGAELAAHGGRLLKRGNSALAMGDPGVSWGDVGARAGVVRRAGATPIAQVERAGVERGLRGLGWEPFGVGDSATMLTGVAGAMRTLPPAAEAETRTSPSRASGSRSASGPGRVRRGLTGR